MKRLGRSCRIDVLKKYPNRQSEAIGSRWLYSLRMLAESPKDFRDASMSCRYFLLSEHAIVTPEGHPLTCHRSTTAPAW